METIGYFQFAIIIYDLVHLNIYVMGLRPLQILFILFIHFIHIIIIITTHYSYSVGFDFRRQNICARDSDVSSRSPHCAG